MQELTQEQVEFVSGSGFKLRVNLGALIGGAVAGFIMGGPVGLGIAIGGGIIAQGVNSLDEMAHGAPY